MWYIKKQRKQGQKTDNHEKNLVVAKNPPIKIHCRRLTYIEARKYLYKKIRKTVIVYAIDYIIQQKTSDQHSECCYKYGLKQNAEF